MSVDAGGVEGRSSLQWGTSTNNAEKTRTTQTATFSSGGKEYKVTVSFNRQAVMEKYNVADDQVDATIQKEISKIGKEQLSKLSGHSISTSLSDPAAKPRFKKIEDVNYRDIPDSISEGAEGDLFRTIDTVRSIFTQTLGRTRGGGKEEDDELSVEIKEVRDPVLHFTPIDEEFTLQKNGTINELTKAAEIAKGLPEGHPYKKNYDKLVPIMQADDLDFEGKDIELHDEYLDQIVVLLGELSSFEEQNAVLINLKDIRFAEEVRYELQAESELQKIKHHLTNHHPLAEADDQLDLLVRANLAFQYDSYDYEVIQEMLAESEPKLTEAQKHEVLNGLLNREKAYDIRAALKLLDSTNIIADYSQGNIPNTNSVIGRVACASICARAMEHLIQMKEIHDAGELIHIMNNGIKDHGKLGTEAKIFGKEPFERLKGRLKGKNIESNHVVERNNIANFEKDQFVVVTAVKGNASEAGETILLFRQGDKYCVFDSHGTSFEGEPKGASVRQFNSSHALDAYISNKYSKDYKISADLIKLAEAA